VRRTGLVLALAAAGWAWAVPGALAAPPNDARSAARPLAPPQRVTGTTVDATNEPAEPRSCARRPTGGSVWYALAPSAARTVLLDLDAAGDLDAVIDVYRRERSQVSAVTCGLTGSDGHARVDFDEEAGAGYLVRVAPRAGSSPDAFTLEARIVQPPARPPGRALPARGVRATVDRATNPDDAWSVRLRAGRSYRVNVVSRPGAPCVRAELFPPGTSSFDEPPARVLPCGGYRLMTPRSEEGGRWSVHVVAPRGERGRSGYRLHVAPARADDTAPGRFIANDARVAGTLHGSHADVLDLYRFDVTFRSTLDLGLRTGRPFDLLLLGGRGRRIACDCAGEGPKRLSLRLRPGRYFAAVRATRGAGGSYVLSRLSKTITRTRVRIDGRRRAAAAPGRAVTIGVAVSPSASGPVTVDVERFDPLFGWQFLRRARPRAVAGRAAVAFRPPSVGHYRATAVFEGTRQSAPSGPEVALLTVAGPLRQ
jgi:hypothetical protein